jgi:hypothetical protein
LIQNLHDFKRYLKESGHSLLKGLNQQLRQAYLIYIYTTGFSTPSDLDIAYIKKAFKEDIRYTSQWIIFLKPLGLGALLVYGEAISRLV